MGANILTDEQYNKFHYIHEFYNYLLEIERIKNADPGGKASHRNTQKITSGDGSKVPSREGI